MEVLFSALLPSSLPIASSTSYKQLNWESWERRKHSPAVAAPRGQTDSAAWGPARTWGQTSSEGLIPQGRGARSWGPCVLGPAPWNQHPLARQLPPVRGREGPVRKSR